MPLELEGNIVGPAPGAVHKAVVERRHESRGNIHEKWSDSKEGCSFVILKRSLRNEGFGRAARCIAVSAMP